MTSQLEVYAVSETRESLRAPCGRRDGTREFHADGGACPEPLSGRHSLHGDPESASVPSRHAGRPSLGLPWSLRAYACNIHASEIAALESGNQHAL